MIKRPSLPYFEKIRNDRSVVRRYVSGYEEIWFAGMVKLQQFELFEEEPAARAYSAPSAVAGLVPFRTDLGSEDMQAWEQLFPEAPEYTYHYDPESAGALFDSPVAEALIQSKAFQRLAHVAFLGAIDYLFHPNGQRANIRHSRFDHSIGVARLAEEYANHTGADAQTRNLLVAAGLLHDIGHGPLSHTLEPEFEKRFGINHHQATEDIILGRINGPLPVDAILKAHGVRPDEVVAVLDKKKNHPHGWLFTGPVNLDTFEGISRSKTYVHPEHVHCHPKLLLEAAVTLDEAALVRLDRFWRLKEDIYRNFIYGPMCFATDFLCQRYMADSGVAIEAADFLLSEPVFLRKHPAFKKHLLQLKDRIELDGIGDVIEDEALTADMGRTAKVKERRFLINDKARIHSFADLPKRYSEQKSIKHKKVGYLGEGDQQAVSSTLFDF
jgi:hypothetical protein